MRQVSQKQLTQNEWTRSAVNAGVEAILFGSVQAVMVASAMLALSSLSKSSRYVGVLYAALIFFTQALYGVLAFVTGSTRLSWISFPSNLNQVGNAIFRLPLRYDTPWIVSLLMVVALVVVSGVALERRVRGVEIVARRPFWPPRSCRNGTGRSSASTT